MSSSHWLAGREAWRIQVARQSSPKTSTSNSEPTWHLSAGPTRPSSRRYSRRFRMVRLVDPLWQHACRHQSTNAASAIPSPTKCEEGPHREALSAAGIQVKNRPAPAVMIFLPIRASIRKIRWTEQVSPHFGKKIKTTLKVSRSARGRVHTSSAFALGMMPKHFSKLIQS